MSLEQQERLAILFMKNSRRRKIKYNKKKTLANSVPFFQKLQPAIVGRNRREIENEAETGKGREETGSA